MKANLPAAVRLFSKARGYIQQAGLGAEVTWQRDADFGAFSESDLLREHAWVTLCSGFRESVVRRVFNQISLCFCDWESSEAIVAAGQVCLLTASSSFANRAKLQGIYSASVHVRTAGFRAFKASAMTDPINKLQVLPYIGPTTSWHLAKNLGLDVAKPDRHLVRVSRSFGFRDAAHFCRELAASTGEQAKVVDLIVWRYIADNPEQLRASFA
jgi:hypothetical protein